MSKAVRIGIVGAGLFGQRHLKGYTQLQNKGEAELVAIADIDDEKRNKASELYGVTPYADYREMIEKENLDAITVVTPDHLHADIALTGLEMDCHVLCEKPMATTMDDARRIVTASEKHPDKIFMVDFHKRLDTYHIECEHAVRQGKLGKIQYGYANMECTLEVGRDWFPNWPAGSSPFWFLGVHFVDTIHWIIKSDAARVFATGRREKLKSLGVDFWDNISSTIVFKNGATFHVDASWTHPEGFEALVDQSLRVIGTDGIFEVDSQDRGSGSALKGEHQRSYNLGVYTERHLPNGKIIYGGYAYESIFEFAYLVNQVLNGGDTKDLKGQYADANDGLEVTKIAYATQLSVEQGGVIIDLDTL